MMDWLVLIALTAFTIWAVVRLFIFLKESWQEDPTRATRKRFLYAAPAIAIFVVVAGGLSWFTTSQWQQKLIPSPSNLAADLARQLNTSDDEASRTAETLAEHGCSTVYSLSTRAMTKVEADRMIEAWTNAVEQVGADGIGSDMRDPAALGQWDVVLVGTFCDETDSEVAAITDALGDAFVGVLLPPLPA
jgi:hypothetical protein